MKIFLQKTVVLSFIILQTLPIKLGDQEYGCPFCQKIAKRIDYMQKHIRTHTGEKPFACTRCSYACTQKSNLNRHMRNDHKIYDYDF